MNRGMKIYILSQNSLSYLSVICKCEVVIDIESFTLHKGFLKMWVHFTAFGVVFVYYF